MTLPNVFLNMDGDVYESIDESYTAQCLYKTLSTAPGGVVDISTLVHLIRDAGWMTDTEYLGNTEELRATLLERENALADSVKINLNAAEASKQMRDQLTEKIKEIDTLKTMLITAQTSARNARNGKDKAENERDALKAELDATREVLKKHEETSGVNLRVKIPTASKYPTSARKEIDIHEYIHGKLKPAPYVKPENNVPRWMRRFVTEVSRG